jgi:hypothetical protein
MSPALREKTQRGGRVRDVPPAAPNRGHVGDTSRQAFGSTWLVYRVFAWARQDSNLDLTDYESAKSREVWLTRAKYERSSLD